MHTNDDKLRALLQAKRCAQTHSAPWSLWDWFIVAILTILAVPTILIVLDTFY